jgi:ArsR family transcriptional regulator, arsenate/arsenite/antimonite-responsive transcriptional repressor
MKLADVVVALEAIAQDSRLGIYRVLVQAGAEGLPAGRIAERMKMPAPTLSFHLAQLRRCGLVTCERHGTSLVYSANFEAMNEIVGYLTENCCGRDVQCAPVCEVPETKARKRAA